MTVYQVGESMREEARFYDFTDILTDPDIVVISIINPSGTILINQEDMTSDETGIYIYNYSIPDDAPIGLWKVIVKGTSGVLNTINNDSFRVVN